MKKLYIFILLFTFTIVQAQNDMKARIEFEEAEKAYEGKDYETALKHLNEAEKLIGKWTPLTSYLKIESLYATTDMGNAFDENMQPLYTEVEKYMDYMHKLNSSEIPTEKYKSVYAIEKELKGFKLDERQNPEFIKAKKQHDTKNYVEAISLYEPLAQKGNSWAMRNIALLYRYGLGVDKDLEEAKKWYKKSIEKDNMQAVEDLGHVYYEEGKFDKALECFLKAAANENPKGIFMLGYLSQNGKGLPLDYKKAEEYYLKATRKNYAEAYYRIGKLYQEGGNGITQNFQTAMNWYLQAAGRGNTNAMRRIGEIHFFGEGGNSSDVSKAIYWFEKAHNNGENSVLRILGRIYYSGTLGIDRDYSKSEKYYLEYFENYKENEDYLNDLIDIYNRGGYGVEKDKEKAKKWKAIRRGS